MFLFSLHYLSHWDGYVVYESFQTGLVSVLSSPFESLRQHESLCSLHARRVSVLSSPFESLRQGRSEERQATDEVVSVLSSPFESLRHGIHKVLFCNSQVSVLSSPFESLRQEKRRRWKHEKGKFLFSLLLLSHWDDYTSPGLRLQMLRFCSLFSFWVIETKVDEDGYIWQRFVSVLSSPFESLRPTTDAHRATWEYQGFCSLFSFWVIETGWVNRMPELPKEVSVLSSPFESLRRGETSIPENDRRFLFSLLLLSHWDFHAYSQLQLASNMVSVLSSPFESLRHGSNKPWVSWVMVSVLSSPFESLRQRLFLASPA